MSGSHRPKLGAIALLCGLSACGQGDGSTDEPVTMLAGQYEAAFAAPALMGGKKSAELKRCISGSAKDFPSMIVRPYLSLDPHCATAKFERTGNRLTGQAVCPLDPDRARGKATVLFEGTIAPESIDGSVTIDMQIESAEDPQAKQAADMMRAVALPFSANRTGDCSR
ncbi:MAG: DUF3617 domain-containing protein [Novosphingobium sp.]